MNDARAKAIGERIKERRQKIGLTQTGLGAAIHEIDPTIWDLGSAQTSVSRLEKGTRIIKITEVNAIGRALGMTYDDLVGETFSIQDDVLRDASLGRAVRALINQDAY